MTTAADPLAALRARFVARCRNDLEVLTELAGDPTRIQDETVRLTLHSLAGSAGTFGFAEISRLAGLLDEAVREGSPLDPSVLAELVGALRAL
jgi:HPt (histidine-containing phosphotransfer) domain-containing protein